MLPRLVDGFETVTVRVKDIGSVVARIIVQPRTRRAIVGGSGRQSRDMESVDLRLTVRHEADMGRATVCMGVAQESEAHVRRECTSGSGNGAGGALHTDERRRCWGSIGRCAGGRSADRCRRRPARQKISRPSAGRIQCAAVHASRCPARQQGTVWARRHTGDAWRESYACGQACWARMNTRAAGAAKAFRSGWHDAVRPCRRSQGYG